MSDNIQKSDLKSNFNITNTTILEIKIKEI
jgi:hypothetical protein